jgi:TRAP-type C4-dicarboxylate transport system permease small subunit
MEDASKPSAQIGPFGRLLEAVCKFFALVGGAILVVITLISSASIIGRSFFGKTILGDFELVQVSMAAAIAAFLPYCQLKQGNIIVDFFTAKASERTQGWLDAFGAFLLAVVAALLSWRAGAGALRAYDDAGSTMILGIPEWIPYAVMTPSLGLLAIVGLYTAWEDLEGIAHHPSTKETSYE